MAPHAVLLDAHRFWMRGCHRCACRIPHLQCFWITSSETLCCLEMDEHLAWMQASTKRTEPTARSYFLDFRVFGGFFSLYSTLEALKHLLEQQEPVPQPWACGHVHWPTSNTLPCSRPLAAVFRIRPMYAAVHNRRGSKGQATREPTTNCQPRNIHNHSNGTTAPPCTLQPFA